MVTQLVEVNEMTLEEAGRILRNGGLVAFPTETVYGLGGDALNPESSSKIYAAKGRPSDNPLIVHIAHTEDLSKVASVVPELAYKLADRFWPGPLTMILPKADCIPKQTTGGLDTVAVRLPSNGVARALIDASGCFIAAPSANLSGRPSPTSASHVYEDFDGRIEMILDGGDVAIGLESTIVDLTCNPPMLLRPGYITADMLAQVCGEVSADVTMMSVAPGQAPKAPGMKYRHYAPKGSLAIVEGQQEEVVRYINEQLSKEMSEGRKTGVIATSETASLYKADLVMDAGSRDCEEQIAHNLYRILREFDEQNIEVMYSEAFGEAGICQAITNRLLKAAGHHVINLSDKMETRLEK